MAIFKAHGSAVTYKRILSESAKADARIFNNSLLIAVISTTILTSLER